MRSDKVEIITISDLIKDKEAKQKELAYYENCLQELVSKMAMVRSQISITETIIDMIKKEDDTLFEDFMKAKDESRILKL